MKAFQSVRSEMRQAADIATHPAEVAGEQPMRHDPAPARHRNMRPPPEDDEESETLPYIQPWMEEAFEALTEASRTGAPFGLMPCTVNGEPTAAIVIASGMDGDRRMRVTPLFVAGTPGMVLLDIKGRRAGSMG